MGAHRATRELTEGGRSRTQPTLRRTAGQEGWSFAHAVGHGIVEQTDDCTTAAAAASQRRRRRADRAVSSATRCRLRVRCAAIRAEIAVTLGAGGIGLVSATVSNGERLTYVSITPRRSVDLRPATSVGPRISPLGPEETFTISAHGSNGNCVGTPTEAVALTTNILALHATSRTFRTVWPAGSNRPDASSLNP